ncbi:MAG: hypothetical protein ACREP3_08480 [Candidatus Binatia bacterium]
MAKGLPASSLGELERMERAVVEMTSLVQSLGRSEDEPAPATNPQPAVSQQATNVYRLFDTTRER